MNTTYAAKIKRPPGVSEEDPLLIPVSNPLSLHLNVRWTTGGVYKNLATSKKWVTIKSNLAALDTAAEIYLASGETGDPFTVVDSKRGRLDCLIPSSLMKTLLVGTVYYIDIQILEDGEPYTVLYDRLRPYQSVTKTVS